MSDVNDISKERFFQSAKNIQKNGAYYTDLDHARRIGYLFDFDCAEEISVLEASAGTGRLPCSDRKLEKGRKHMKLFLVELSEETFKEKLEGREEFNYVLNADFLDGVKISNSKFTFAFANWPYGTSKRRKVTPGDEISRKGVQLSRDRRLPCSGSPKSCP